MNVDARFTEAGLSGVLGLARRFEAAGYDAVWAPESRHDPFLPVAAAATVTTRLRLGTSIAVAFARSPTTVAYAAHDLQTYTGGRFVLGLGSQVKAHIERRFGMAWSRPVPRMREYVAAIRAIWQCWNDQARLDFRGDFYSLTLMPPPFVPEATPHPSPPIYLAGVGVAMTRVAGEVADGIFAHALTTPDYVRDVTLSALEDGARRVGRELVDFEVCVPVYVVTGAATNEVQRARKAVRDQIAFYASTPTYHPVLAHHGWEALAHELHALSRSDVADKWRRMGDAIGDDVLETFAVCAEPGDVAAELLRRYDGVANRVSMHVPYAIDPALVDSIATDIKRLGVRARA